MPQAISDNKKKTEETMETFWMYFLFVVGVVLIVKGGDWFVDGAVWVAEVTRIPKFIIGATIISVATTLPEIFVSTFAAIEGHSILVSGAADCVAASQDKVGMAIGNGIGSVVCNTAMILAISIIFMPIAVKRREYAPKALLLLAAVITLFCFSLGGSFSIAGALVLLLIFALYIAENIRSAKSGEADEPDECPATDRKSVVMNILRVVGGAAGIDTTLILAICSFIYGGKLPVSAQSIYLDFPVAILVSLIAAVPTIIQKKFCRWQGVFMLLIYITYLVVVTTALAPYLALFGVAA